MRANLKNVLLLKEFCKILIREMLSIVELLIVTVLLADLIIC